MPDFQDHCTVRPGLPGHGTTRAMNYFTKITVFFVYTQEDMISRSVHMLS